MGHKVKIYGAISESLWGIGEKIWEYPNEPSNSLKYSEKYDRF